MADQLADWDARIAALNTSLASAVSILADIPVTESRSNEWRRSLDQSWMEYASFLVIIMVPGFAMLEAGCLRRRQLFTTVFQNLTILAIGILIWWFCGFGFAFGENVSHNRNGFIGNDDILLVSSDRTGGNYPATGYAFFFFNFAVAAAATLIQSGASGERLSIVGWVLHVIVFLGLVYPVGAHWIWSKSGFFSPWVEGLHRLGRNGVIDIAGDGAIHMAGGTSALACILIIGKRNGRFDEGVDQKPFGEGGNKMLKLIGTLLLWVGWYGFNPGSLLHITGNYSLVAQKYAVATFLSPCSAAVTGFLINALYKRKFDFDHINNSLLAGLVAVTGGGAVIEPWAAITAGFIAAFVYQFAAFVVKTFKIDDAVGAVQVHLFGGFWGLLVPGIFATKPNVEAFLQRETDAFGFLYGGGGNQFGVQIFFALIIFLWHFTCAVILFSALKGLGLLRISAEDEAASLDNPSETSSYGEVKAVEAAEQELAEVAEAAAETECQV